MSRSRPCALDLAQLAALQQATAQKTDRVDAIAGVARRPNSRSCWRQAAREQVLNKLSAQIQQQRREISTLKRDERSLTQLVERLNRVMAQQAAREAARARAAQQAKKSPKTRQVEKDVDSRTRKGVAVNTETPVAFNSGRSFSSLKGSLHLPVAGELMNRFGAPREGGGVSWKGVFIRARQGATVKSIAAGQVVFCRVVAGLRQPHYCRPRRGLHEPVQQ